MTTEYRVAVLGATGVVGKEILSILLERQFPCSGVVAIASARSGGQAIDVGGQSFDVISAEDFNPKDADIILASAGAEVSKKYLDKWAASGAYVVDNSSYFRADPEVPLIIPEVNPKALALAKTKNIIANPNCSTIQMLMALAPLHFVNPLIRIVTSSYQSVSGGGAEALEELFNQTRDIYGNTSADKSRQVFTKQIAFNVIPHIDEFMATGYTKEEWKMDFESKKILQSNVLVSATCVRVPVFVGHALAVTAQFTDAISVKQALSLWKDFPGVSVINYNSDEGYVTPVEAAGEDKVYISRVRQDSALPNALSFWVVADNLRKGAALNAVQIAELLVANQLIPN